MKTTQRLPNGCHAAAWIELYSDVWFKPFHPWASPRKAPVFANYDQDIDPALFTDSGGHPVTCVVNVLYPWITWDAVNAALAEGRNWNWFNGP